MNFKRSVLYFRALMPVFFLAIGLYCLLYPEKVNLEIQVSRIMGFLLIGYAIFRGYRAWKDIQKEDSQTEK